MAPLPDQGRAPIDLTPSEPSSQLKAILVLLELSEEWYLETLGQSSALNFAQKPLPAVFGRSSSKKEPRYQDSPPLRLAERRPPKSA